MSSIGEIVSYLNYGRAALLDSIEGLSIREMTEFPIYEGWTIHEVLAHVIGWDKRVINILPLIINDCAGDVASVEVQAHNKQSVAACKDMPINELLAEIKQTHQQIIDVVSGLEHREIDLRRERKGRTITIRSYVIDVMVEHERQHAVEIELWRKQLERRIDPDAIKNRLIQWRGQFMACLDEWSRAEALAPATVGRWSIDDVVAHLAEWERLMLAAAAHIHDPSQPQPPTLTDSLEDWNRTLAQRRADNSWAENVQYLRAVQADVDRFLATLTPGDWLLRGPYPWPNDQGTLAELVIHITEHYEDHLSDVENRQGNDL